MVEIFSTSIINSKISEILFFEFIECKMVSVMPVISKSKNIVNYFAICCIDNLHIYRVVVLLIKKCFSIM